LGLSACKREPETTLTPKTSTPTEATLSQIKQWYDKKIEKIKNEKSTATIFLPQWGEGLLHVLNDGTRLAVFPVWREVAVQYYEVGFVRRLVVKLDTEDNVLEAKIMEVISSKAYLAAHKDEIPVRFYEGVLKNREALVDLEPLDADDFREKQCGGGKVKVLGVDWSNCRASVVDYCGGVRYFEDVCSTGGSGSGGNSGGGSTPILTNPGGVGAIGGGGSNGSSSYPIFTTKDGAEGIDRGDNTLYSSSIDNWNLIVTPNYVSPGYPVTHQVSQTIINYNQYVWWAFEGSNNISTISLHHGIKNGDTNGDTYRKGLGAIGEGLFCQILWENEVHLLYPPPPNRFGHFRFGHSQGGYRHDVFLHVPISRVSLAVNYSVPILYTDLQGQVQRADVNMIKSGLSSEAQISYEVKTLGSQNAPRFNFDRIKDGIEEVKQRVAVSDIAVLVIDKDGFDVVMNSTYKDSLLSELAVLNSYLNELGQQKIYLRLEIGLHENARRSYYAIKDRIINIP
jgi:hypothetical protein